MAAQRRRGTQATTTTTAMLATAPPPALKSGVNFKRVERYDNCEHEAVDRGAAGRHSRRPKNDAWLLSSPARSLSLFLYLPLSRQSKGRDRF